MIPPEILEKQGIITHDEALARRAEYDAMVDARKVRVSDPDELSRLLEENRGGMVTADGVDLGVQEEDGKIVLFESNTDEDKGTFPDFHSAAEAVIADSGRVAFMPFMPPT